MSRTKTLNIELRLLLSDEQISTLRQIRDFSTGEDDSFAPIDFLIKSVFGADRAIVIPGASFSTHGDHLTVRHLGDFATASHIGRRGVGYRKKRLCILERGCDWVAYVCLEKPKAQLAKGGKRIYSDSAIFVTGKVSPRKVSGGLPSLGRRK